MGSWEQIRGLSYSTMGRNIRATVFTNDGEPNRAWFAPPAMCRIEDADGSPQFIENESDRYEFGAEGPTVHIPKSPNQIVVGDRLSPLLLFTAYRLWLPPEVSRPQLGDPVSIVEVQCRGRRGWQLDFQASHGNPPISVVIDAELGVTLSWSQGGQRLQMENPVLDEEFDSSLFTWDGPTQTLEDCFESTQHDYQRKRRDLAEMPATRVGWLPMDIEITPIEGDPLSGTLEVRATARSPYVSIRRWLTAVGEPVEAGWMDPSQPVVRTVAGEWTIELQAHSTLSDEDAEQILASVELPNPPGDIEVLRREIAARQSADAAAEADARLGVGAVLDDYLHGSHDVSLLVRTDFTDDERWREIALAAMAPVESGLEGEYSTFQAGLTCVDNRENDGLTVDELVARIGAEDPPYYAFVADSTTMAHPEMAIQVIDCGLVEYGDEPGRTFRVIPTEMWSVENNLSISNMDFAAFADSVDEDGIFRGFPPPPPPVGVLGHDDLIALSETNRSTPALIRLADELPSMANASVVLHESPRAELHEFATALDSDPDEIRVGVADYLEATARDGLCHSGFIQIDRGHWNLIVDPETGVLEAAMLRQYRPQPSA